MRPTFTRLFLLLILPFILTDCKKEDALELPAPVITSFSPAGGVAGTAVQIVGLNFAALANDNDVKFNGASATVSAASPTTLTALVPSGVTSGKISVSVGDRTATTAANFEVYQTPTITSFTPATYDTNDALPVITITGTNFSTAANEIKLNDLTFEPTEQTATQLKFMLKAAAKSGKFKVTSHGMQATSLNDFVVTCPDVTITFIQIKNLSGNTFTGDYTLKNIGTAPLNISNMYIEALSCTKSTIDEVGAQYTLAKRFDNFGSSETVIPPNGVRGKSASITVSSVAQYPYIILRIFTDGTVSKECNVLNNSLGQKIE